MIVGRQASFSNIETPDWRPEDEGLDSSLVPQPVSQEVMGELPVKHAKPRAKVRHITPYTREMSAAAAAALRSGPKLPFLSQLPARYAVAPAPRQELNSVTRVSENFLQADVTLVGGEGLPEPLEASVDLLEYARRVLETTIEPFTFKSNTYQSHLKHLLPVPPDGKRHAIERIAKMPDLPLSKRDLDILDQIRRESGRPDAILAVEAVRSYRNLLKSSLADLLVSMVNKILFLLLLQYRSWCIRAPARAQIREFLIAYIWPDNIPLQNLYRSSVNTLIEPRIRHFRDSIARYFRVRGVKNAETRHPTSEAQTDQHESFESSFLPVEASQAPHDLMSMPPRMHSLHLNLDADYLKAEDLLAQGW